MPTGEKKRAARKTGKTTAGNSFSREDTKMVKGFAIVLMLMHHLWAFPERISGGALRALLNLSGESIPYLLGGFGKICVSLFFLLGGYGIYCQSKKKDFSIINSIKRVYLAYWKVFVVFIPIAFLFFANQGQYCESSSIWARYSHFSWGVVIKNFLGFSSDLNGEWWFLFSYLVAILTFPFWKRLFEKISPYKAIPIVIFVSVSMTYLFPALGNVEALGPLNNSYLYKRLLCQPGEYYSCFLMGILCAQYDWLSKIRLALRKHFKINVLTGLLAVAAIVFLRQSTTGASLDIFYAPLLTVCLLEITRPFSLLARALRAIGRHSTTIWLTHSYWCYYFFPVVQIIVWTRWAVPSFITLLALSYVVAVCFDRAWSFAAKICANVLRGFRD